MLSKSDWISLGVTLIGIWLAYQFSGPKAAVICGIVGVVLILGAHFFLRDKAEIPSPAPVQQTQSASPTLTASPNIQQHVHIHGEASAKPTPSPPKPQVAPTKPNLLCVGARRIHFHVGLNEAFYENDNQDDPWAVIACFRNEPSLDKKLAVASGVRACMVFRDNDGQEIGSGISSGCWIGVVADRVDISVGESRCVVMAVPAGETVSCPYKESHYVHYGGVAFTGRVYELGQHLKSIELRLISGTDLLLEPIVFDYSVVDGKPIIKRRPAVLP